MNGLGGHPLVPRVNWDAGPEAAERVRSSELAQYQWAMSLLLAFHELMCAQGHTLPETGDHERVSDREEREVLAEREILRVQENDRLVCEGREPRVQMRDDIRDTSLCLVLFCCLQRNLDEHRLALILWVLVEKHFKSLNFVSDTLYDVQFVATDDYLLACVALLENVDPLNDFGVMPSGVR